MPEIPSSFRNRRRANWKPLLAIAERVGGSWKEAGVEARPAIEAVRDTFDPSIGVELLGAVRDIFVEDGIDRIRSKSLVEALVE